MPQQENGRFWLAQKSWMKPATARDSPQRFTRGKEMANKSSNNIFNNPFPPHLAQLDNCMWHCTWPGTEFYCDNILWFTKLGKCGVRLLVINNDQSNLSKPNQFKGSWQTNRPVNLTKHLQDVMEQLAPDWAQRSAVSVPILDLTGHPTRSGSRSEPFWQNIVDLHKTGTFGGCSWYCRCKSGSHGSRFKWIDLVNRPFGFDERTVGFTGNTRTRTVVFVFPS